MVGPCALKFSCPCEPRKLQNSLTALKPTKKPVVNVFFAFPSPTKENPPLGFEIVGSALEQKFVEKLPNLNRMCVFA